MIKLKPKGQRAVPRSMFKKDKGKRIKDENRKDVVVIGQVP